MIISSFHTAPQYDQKCVNCLRFANPAEALGSRHPEAQRRGGLEVWRLQCDGLDKFLHVVDAVP